MPRSRESEVLRLARKLALRPCNRNGADKTWVVVVLQHVEDFFKSARRIRR